MGHLQNENLWGYRKRLNSIAEVARNAFPHLLPDQIRVLDVGCGNASLLGIPLAQMGFEYTGIDVHAPSIASAQAAAEGLSNARFSVAQASGWTDNPYHVVILSEVLEHLDEPEHLLADSIRHMRSDGIMIVTVPNGYGEFEWDSMIFRVTGLAAIAERVVWRRRERGGDVSSGSTENHEAGHVQFFTQGRLERLFAKNGLETTGRRSLSFVSGPFVKFTLGRSQRFVDWNSSVADRLPMSMSSGWLFVLRQRDASG